ncbi:tetratricopeptide repeat protein [Amycolatopsis sp. NPDC049159]|uniref:AfsR/SARP family transcriptional regulator n=1 Tax=Amycolatopsis sp. NPDC049159 TaxID=3157210 RepID=UPI0033ED1EFD
MEIRLLGPLVVCVDGRDVVISSPIAKGLLTVLVLAPNRTMRHTEIVTRLWPHDRAPLDRVREARRALGERLPAVKPRNKNQQCMIDLSDWSVDFIRFTSGLTEAKRLEGQDRVERLRKTLAEWRSEPLMEADLEKFDLSREREYLDDLHRAASCELLQAMSDCGDMKGFRNTVHDIVRRWPHDVPLLSLATDVLADAESGARAGTFLDGHIREHGDPQGRLAELRPRFGPPPPTAAPLAAVPHQLPGCDPVLVGRQAELDALSEALVSTDDGDTRIAVVSGMAGVGKTSLVRTWAKGVEDAAFPGGTLYADLNGFGALSPENPEQILARFLKDLDVEAPTSTLDGLITTFRTATAGRAVLVVLDNARDSAQARPLLPGAGCSVVVTSRLRLESLIAREGARPLVLRPLARPEAVAMLSGSLGADRMRHAGHLVGEIAELVGGLPLALAVVAARLARHPADAVRSIRDALRETKTRLDALSLGREPDLDVRVALSYSHDGLTSAAAELWAVLALHPGPTISLDAAADLVGRTCTAEIAELVAAHLLDEPVYERYAMHDLVRDYGLELAGLLEPGRIEEVASAAFEYLLHHAWACDRALVPDRELPIPTPAKGEVAVPPSAQDAMSWLDAEYSTITAALRAAVESGADQYTWLLAMTLVTYQWRRSKFADADRYLREAAEAAGRVAGPADEAMVYRMLGGSRWNMKQYTLAEGAQRHAVRLSEQAGDERGLAYGHLGLATIYLARDEHPSAHAEFEKAHMLFRRLADETGEADALSGLARVALAEGEHDRAAQACSEARQRFAQVGDVNAEAAVLVVLGDVHADRGDLPRAAATYDVAISAYRSLTRRSHEARTLVRLAEVLRLDGRQDEEEQALRRARALYDELGDTAAFEQIDNVLTKAQEAF